MRLLSNRTEGAAARSASRRDDLADKIAEAIVDERYGRGNVSRAREHVRRVRDLI
jgi:hypothetical protein